MDINIPSRRRIIIQALHDSPVWQRTVQGYPITITRLEDGKVGWKVCVFKPTRKVQGEYCEGVEGTVFDALVAVEKAIERKIMRAEYE